MRSFYQLAISYHDYSYGVYSIPFKKSLADVMMNNRTRCEERLREGSENKCVERANKTASLCQATTISVLFVVALQFIKPHFHAKNAHILFLVWLFVCMLLSQRGWQRQFCRSRLIISDDRWIPCRVSLCVSIFCSFMCLFLWHRGYVSCVPACYDSSSIVVLIKIFTLCGCREWVKCKHCHWTGFTWYFLSIEFFGGLLSGWLCPAHLSPPFPAG